MAVTVHWSRSLVPVTEWVVVPFASVSDLHFGHGSGDGSRTVMGRVFWDSLVVVGAQPEPLIGRADRGPEPPRAVRSRIPVLVRVGTDVGVTGTDSSATGPAQ